MLQGDNKDDVRALDPLHIASRMLPFMGLVEPDRHPFAAVASTTVETRACVAPSAPQSWETTRRVICARAYPNRQIFFVVRGREEEEDGARVYERQTDEGTDVTRAHPGRAHTEEEERTVQRGWRYRPLERASSLREIAEDDCLMAGSSSVDVLRRAEDIEREIVCRASMERSTTSRARWSPTSDGTTTGGEDETRVGGADRTAVLHGRVPTEIQRAPPTWRCPPATSAPAAPTTLSSSSARRGRRAALSAATRSPTFARFCPPPPSTRSSSSAST